MLKKRAAIFLMTIAYAILLGHSIVPHHHHHETNQHLKKHHTDHHQHADHSDSDDLKNLFANFLHDADGFSFTSSHIISSNFSKQQLTFIYTLPENFILDEFHIPPLLEKPHLETAIYIAPFFDSSGLRAPPLNFI